MDSYYPPQSFYFSVSIGGSEMTFKEASGFDVETEIEEIAEGGQNNYKHRVPGRTKYANLILKRGTAIQDSDILDWVSDSLQGGHSRRIKTKTVQVSLLDEKTGNPLMTWSFNRAFPIKWKVSDMNAEESAISIETVEFAFQDYKVN